MQWRIAIGSHNNFIKCKEIKCLIQLIRKVRDLYSYYGCILLFMLININPSFAYMMLLLLKCGDVEVNPGPTSFCHLNARSLLSGVDLNKHLESQYSLLDEIYETLVYVNEFDIIAIGETWLSDNVSDSDLTLSGYHVPFYKHRGARGGGVMLYVKEHIGAIHRTDLEKNNTEILWAEIRLQSKKVLLGVAYRPPGMTSLQVDDFLDSLNDQIENAANENPDALLLLGDFNDRCVHWDDRHASSEMGLKFYNFIHDRNLFQLVDEPTRITDTSDSLLDLIITDSPGFIDNVNTLPPLSDLDHNIIYGQLTFSSDRPINIRRLVWNYNRADFQNLNNEFAAADWDMAFTLYEDVNDILDFYYDIIAQGMNNHIPKKFLSKRKKDKPWMTGHIRHLILLRNRLNGVYQRTKRLEHKIERNRMRALVKKEIKIAKRKYDAGLKYTLEDKNLDVKRFWSIMKQLFGSKVKAGIPTLIDNNVPYSSDLDKANLFAEYFADQCSLPDPPANYVLPPVTPITNARLSNVNFEVHQVAKIMEKLNVSKASGPDQISYRLLKECAQSLAEPLCRLFDKSFLDGVFPSKWKISNISPVFKKALRHLKENYRPVSLLSCLSKIMERVVFNAMYQYFKLHGLLTERNSGFKERDSTINQLIHLCHNIYNGLDNSRDVCLVFLDVSKAFDKVYHPALMVKLQNMGIHGNLLNWIKSYL